MGTGCQPRPWLSQLTEKVVLTELAARVIGVSVPAFVSGIFLLYLLAIDVGWFPVYGPGTGFPDRLWHLTLPAVTIALSMSPLQVRALRSSLIEVLTADYITTARACGLRRSFVVRSYLWRNSVLPLITVFGVNLGWLIGGTVIVEQVFSIPGLGSLLINSIATRDYAIIQLVTTVLALFIIVANLATDLAYAIFDPRVTFQS